MTKRTKTFTKKCIVCGHEFQTTSNNALCCSEVCKRVRMHNEDIKRRAYERAKSKETDVWIREHNAEIERVNESYKKKAAERAKQQKTCPHKQTCKYGLFLGHVGWACNYYCVTGELIPREEKENGNCPHYEKKTAEHKKENQERFNPHSK